MYLVHLESARLALRQNFRKKSRPIPTAGAIPAFAALNRKPFARDLTKFEPHQNAQQCPNFLTTGRINSPLGG